MNESQTAVRTLVAAIVCAGFGFAGVMFVAGYFFFLRLQKKSRDKGREEAEEEGVR